jgi:protein JSN1
MTSASDLRDYFELANSSDNTLKLGNMHPRPSSGEGGLASIEESSLEGPTRSLWLGNIPASTTTTSLVHIFQGFGNVESARVLTHKNCGFVNFNSVDSAIQARSNLNGKEIFPGAGPVRIGFAKPSSAGSNGTPTPNGGAYGSPSPGPQGDSVPPATGEAALPRDGRNGSGVNGKDSRSDGPAALKLPDLTEIREDIVKIVQEFGAEVDDAQMVGNNIDKAVEYQTFEPEIPPIPEPTHNRVHDAPKLRDIRKRIDNGNCSQAEIEEIATAMLNEIAELSSGLIASPCMEKPGD